MPTQLKLQGLSFRRGLTAPWLFHDVNLCLTPGLYGLLGLNGCGKTTFIKCLAGIQQAYSGRISFTLHGKHLQHQHFKERLGYVPQEFAFYEEFNVEKYLTYVAEMKLIPSKVVPERVELLIEQFDLSEHRACRIDTLSTGQKKRLMLAQALLADPYLILLDEPLDGLDLEERYRVMALLHSLASNRIIILASHIISEVEQWLEQVLFMTGQQMSGPRTPRHWKKTLLFNPTEKHDVKHSSNEAHRADHEPTLEEVLFWLLNRS